MVGVKVIDRYIGLEFLPVFLISVLGFFVIILSSQLFWLTDLLILKRVPLATVARLLAFKAPDVIAQSLPISALFGSLLSLSRLAKDSELAALRAGGMKPSRILLPFVFLGTVIWGITFFLNEDVVPAANHRYESTVRRIFLEEALPTLKENVFLKAAGERFFYVERVNTATKELYNPMVYEAGKGRPPRIITAKRGRAREGVWRLSDGVIHELDSEGLVDYEVRFEEMEIRMDEGLDIFLGEQKTPQEMSRRELMEHIRLFQRSGVSVDALMVDYQLKLALPFASVILILVGPPLATFATCHAKSGRLWGGAVGVGVAVTYYVVASLARSLGCNGNIPPLLAAWGPNALLGLLGLFLLVRNDARV